AQRHAFVCIQNDLATARFDGPFLAPLSLHERLGRWLGLSGRELHRDLLAAAASDLRGAEIRELDARREQIPRRRDRREERVADLVRLVGMLRRAAMPALIARPQEQLA